MDRIPVRSQLRGRWPVDVQISGPESWFMCLTFSILKGGSAFRKEIREVSILMAEIPPPKSSSKKNRPTPDLCAEADTDWSACVLYILCKPSLQWVVRRWVRDHELSVIFRGMYRTFPPDYSVLPLPVSISFLTSNDIMTNPSLAEVWLLCSHSSVSPPYMEKKEGVFLF